MVVVPCDQCPCKMTACDQPVQVMLVDDPVVQQVHSLFSCEPMNWSVTLVLVALEGILVSK